MTFSLWWIFTYYFRSVIKWFLRKTTGLCELQRICYGEIPGAPRIRKVEYSLFMSKSHQVKQLIQHLNSISDNNGFIGPNEPEILNGAVKVVMLVKKIDPKIHFQFVKSFGKCVEQIWGYRQLIAEAEQLRTTNYDSDDPEHEAKLQNLWMKLKPNDKLEGRITKQWQEIGFQGEDPKTDFRGMGLLGLENLLYFSTVYSSAAQHVLGHSYHPVYGYCFAIVGINLTSLAWTLLKEGSAKTYIYNNSAGAPSIKLFHQFYSYLFYEFDRFWMDCKPKDIMEFSNIKNKFEDNVRMNLQDPTADFRIGVTVDNV
ncbi:ELMO domain-containing protein 2 [Diabrotica virgifera virgifera]|uniref:ELMO domain-containing protein n=1 Tax=Diabrotica virgifera virgifera TaxID=50390 RepID=A0ABM5IBY4_DIAVI|nr:ELMO domain-containing protein 2 [Diabrotica virgifera virgifera]